MNEQFEKWKILRQKIMDETFDLFEERLNYKYPKYPPDWLFTLRTIRDTIRNEIFFEKKLPK